MAFFHEDGYLPVDMLDVSIYLLVFVIVARLPGWLWNRRVKREDTPMTMVELTKWMLLLRLGSLLNLTGLVLSLIVLAAAIVELYRLLS